MESNEKVRIDLHIHSTASDGTLSPEEILAVASSVGLGAISITDHDTLEGARLVLSCTIPDSLGFLTGVEISSAFPDGFNYGGSLHILGYGVNVDDMRLNAVLGKLQASRRDRNPLMIRRLNRLGIDITIEDVLHRFGDSQIGRPHIARILVEKGVVASIDQAFDRYIGKGKPAYADKYRITCPQAIDVIRGAGGLPVMAHPGLLESNQGPEFERFLALLVPMGLKGIEVFYPKHTKDQTEYYLSLAVQHNLLVTGGTDFHGAVTPGIEMGKGNGNLIIPYSLYQAIIEYLANVS